MEKWRVIPGFSAYEVSDAGRIRRCAPDAMGRWTHVGRVLTPHVGPTGYPRVALAADDGLRQNVCLHRAVALAFLPNPAEHPFVCHRDGSRDNNTPSNLYWGTQAQNMRDRVMHGRQPTTAKGRKSRWTMETARAIRSEYTGARGEPGALAAKYGVSPSMVYYILSGKVYKETDGSACRIPRKFGLTPMGVRVVRRLKGILSGPKIAEMFGCSHRTIYNVWNNAAYTGGVL